jgi:hypothetical protein
MHTLFHSPKIGLVHLHPSAHAVSARPYHRSPEFVQPCPSGLVASQSQDRLQPNRTGTVLLTCKPIHSPKPVRQGLARVLKDRPRRDRCLMAALSALHPHRAHRPVAIRDAFRTTKPLRPAHLEQVIPTCLLRSKPSLEFPQIAGIILHAAKHYSLGLPESSK